MKIIRQISEDEMIAEFLMAEIKSDRYSSFIIDKLNELNKSSNIVMNPNLDSLDDCALRKEILHSYRGKERRFFGEQLKTAKEARLDGHPILEDLPKNINWYRAVFTKKDLENVKYINYSYWNEISDNTRSPKIAAKNILSGRKAFEVSNDRFLKIADSIAKQVKLAEMILLAPDEVNYPVVLEGHARLTAYFVNKKIPNKLSVIIGFSKNINNWNLY